MPRCAATLMGMNSLRQWGNGAMPALQSSRSRHSLEAGAMRLLKPVVLVSVAAVLSLPRPVDAVRAQEPAAAEVSAKTWMGRAAEIEDYLRTAEIVKCDATAVGVTHPRKCSLK